MASGSMMSGCIASGRMVTGAWWVGAWSAWAGGVVAFIGLASRKPAKGDEAGASSR